MSETNEGVLYVVATPIGNLEDLSARAARVLGEVDRIAAEDTRHTQRLLRHLGIERPLVSLHEHNEAARAEWLRERLAAGERLALVSDAGTPLISDPGFVLVRELRRSGFRVVPVPGACALVAALSVAGLPTDRFLFEGFLPAKSAARRRQLEADAERTETRVFYESPHRIRDLLADLEATLGARRVVLARELTKTFETLLEGTPEELLARMAADPDQTRGEFVVMVAGAEPAGRATDTAEGEALIAAMLAEGVGVKSAAAVATKVLGGRRKQWYQLALAQQSDAD
ncbi:MULTISPECIES: 16S rRNA (cytidine(1402)-2'-O)-methyltransferase [unclassified Salinicola]|uniref:16S rRNA (cytidine(1402)-2'-O)-methyltransferase n=1 Tax=unclassified Salinicola TaxID=2634022 RepID=UPI001A8FDFA6|nr:MULTISPECIES: 16S rRNA (cytidine(1402)-2'-O)-methyltransferase [unclassified Salinicola]MCE3027558.1 16S rRNA (cytidine(1402)-2'-O)-methyltransferase [Salinicola sp. DM10]WIX34253.1 16S rRNA (cytidine(1402)-2'-O)-methyltransferase [Salinicola sp. JS01]